MPKYYSAEESEEILKKVIANENASEGFKRELSKFLTVSKLLSVRNVIITSLVVAMSSFILLLLYGRYTIANAVILSGIVASFALVIRGVYLAILLTYSYQKTRQALTD